MVLLCSERFIHQIQSRRKVLKSRKSHTPHGGRDWCLPPRVQQLVSLHEVPLPARQLQSEGCVCCFVQQRWQITTLGSMTRFSGLGKTFSVSNWCTPERRVPTAHYGASDDHWSHVKHCYSSTLSTYRYIWCSRADVGHAVGLCNVPDTCLPPAMRLDNWLGPIRRLLLVSLLSHGRSLVVCCGLLMKGGSTFQFRNPHAKSHLGPSPTVP